MNFLQPTVWFHWFFFLSKLSLNWYHFLCWIIMVTTTCSTLSHQHSVTNNVMRDASLSVSMMLAGKVSHTKRTCWSRKSSHNTGLECDERCELVADWTVTESCSPPTTFISQSVSSPVTLTPPVSTLTVLQDLSQPATMTENEFKRWPICAFPSSVHLTIKTVEWMGCTVVPY